jgi:cell division protein FtsB|tara:strand:+ start:163 stop:312 length:150 start_codon:yes stop_codon:yes gene_type:complete
MVSNKELQDVVAQVNSSYTVLLNKITKLEAEMELLSSSNTLKKQSKEKS